MTGLSVNLNFYFVHIGRVNQIAYIVEGNAEKKLILASVKYAWDLVLVTKFFRIFFPYAHTG